MVRRRPRSFFDPYYLDLAGFLQVLVDVMVSCPLPSLRARGHAAISAFLAAADEGSRFRALKRLIERCPWPNAAGLLLDAFRREVDRALRCEPAERISLIAAPQDSGTGGINSGGCFPSPTENSSDSGEAGGREQVGPGSSCTPDDAAEMLAAGAAEVAETSAGASPPQNCVGMEASPFASPLAGDFVCEQLRRACRKGPPASMLMDMDSRTGGLMLARYAHALDGAGGNGENVGTVTRRERLMLRQPQRLRDNQRLVEVSRSGVRYLVFTRRQTACALSSWDWVAPDAHVDGFDIWCLFSVPPAVLHGQDASTEYYVFGPLDCSFIAFFRGSASLPRALLLPHSSLPVRVPIRDTSLFVVVSQH